LTKEAKIARLDYLLHEIGFNPYLTNDQARSMKAEYMRMSREVEKPLAVTRG